MILAAETEIKGVDHLPKEELKMVKEHYKKELAIKIAEKMLSTGLIEVQELEGGFNPKEIRLRLTTVVLNPEQLEHINGLLALEPCRKMVMDELTNK